MAGIDEGDDFFDDVLDNLGSDDYHQLQQQAFTATQTPHVPFHNGQVGLQELPQAPERLTHLSKVAAPPDEDPLLLDEPSVQDELTTRRPVNTFRAPGLAVNNPASLNVRKQPNEGTQREQWRQQRYGNGSNARGTPISNHGTNGAQNLALPHRAPKAGQNGASGQAQTRGPATQQDGADVDGYEMQQALRRELEQARLEISKLGNAVKSANDQVSAKNGEIAIIRSNQAKALREHEKRLEDIRMQQQKDNERHRTEIESAQKEREKLATHNQFLDHEINDQNYQLKQAQRSKKPLPRQPGNETPKKATGAPLRDGFDDDEIMIVSLQKSGGRGKSSTPRHGAKRKRDLHGATPTQPLQLDHDGDRLLPDIDVPTQPGLPTEPEPRGTADSSGRDKERLKFLQGVLDHRMSRHEKRTLETLSQFSLPSRRAENSTIASDIMDVMAPLGNRPGLEDYPGAVGSAILTVWSKCLDEQYYEPVRFFIDLVKFILIISPRSSVASIVSQLVVVTQSTADVNILPRYRRKRRPATASSVASVGNIKAQEGHPPADDQSLHVDTQDCLQLLNLAGTLLRRQPDALSALWGAMRFDFISMILRPFQDIADVIALVRLLSTSMRADGFAMVVPPEANQAKSEAHVLDRVTAMLVEVPRPPEGEAEVDPALVVEMRLQILESIEAMCGRKYCAQALARHPLALGRLARTLHDELAALYDYRHGHELRIELVNRTTRLLFHLTIHYADDIGDLQAKLRATSPTSVYKYLIGLSRLAFTDGVFLERGIDEDVQDCAMQMLEVLVTPEEAEELQRAFVKDA